MTIIVYRDGIMAADMQVTGGNSVKGFSRKIAKNTKGDLIGLAGDAGWAAAVLAWFLQGEKSKPPTYVDPSDHSCGSVLIVRAKNPKIVHRIMGDDNWYVAAMHGTASGGFCIGSGNEIAAGALFMGASAIDAVKAAIALECGCGGDILAIPHKGPEKIIRNKQSWLT